MEHEEVVVRRGSRSRVPMIIALHSRALGPAVGGVRLRRYPDWRDGLEDALRLSTAMTYKCAAADLPFGGGKTVLALDPSTPLTAEFRQAVLDDLGEFIASFDGAYIAGPDVGTGPADMAALREHTPNVFCLPENQGGTGSSSGPTAVGVLAALRAGMRHVFGSDQVAGKTVVISGLGSVGALIAKGLPGARIIASDVDESKRELGYEWIEPDQVLTTPADVLIPAAVGGLLDPAAIERLRVPLVVGPANNQLTDDTLAEALATKGVVWIPDFVASAGGVIYTLGREIEGLDDQDAGARVDAIESTVDKILAGPGTPLAAAMSLATGRIGRS